MNLLPLLAETSSTFLLPRQASNLAVDVDWAWNIILWVTGFFFCVVVFAMTFFVIKYRRRTPNDATSEITHNTPLEVVWTVIPLILVMGFFFVGFKGFINYDTPASQSTVIDVEARKWAFTFTYPNGAVSDALYVEVNKPVRLNLHSVDVLHALYLPAFRVQRNLIPYRQTSLWFIPTEESPRPTKSDAGGFPIFCTQYCGDNHSKMFTRVHVLAKADFDAKMKELANPFKKKDENGNDVYVPYTELGGKLWSQMGCNSCHTVDGKNGIGPTWKDLWKRDHTFASSDIPGYTLTAADPDQKWEEYLTESILNPGAKVVASYQNQMPSFAAQLSGSPSNDEKRRAIIEYIKSIGNQPYKPAVDPAADKALFDATKNPNHPESLAARAAQTQPAPAQPGQQ
jgi:cytochrome c oxidase subunit 2